MWKHAWLAACLAFAVFVVGAGAADDTNDAPRGSAGTDAEKAIRATADSFIESFKKRDASAIAAHWTEDGVYINEDGLRFEGRKSIQSEYETLLADSGDELALQLEIDSIRLINPQTAIEEGRAALTPQPPGAVRVMSRYTAVHVKQDGQWLMAEVRDTRLELPADPGQLEDLGWLVGNWSATNDEALVEVKCGWIENRHFVLRTHAVTESGERTSGGVEIIGLDPSTGRITSWSFTNDGGHAVGIWAPHESGWAVESAGVLNDGTPTTAINVLSRKEDDTLLWKSVSRTVGGMPLPDTAEIALNRSR